MWRSLRAGMGLAVALFFLSLACAPQAGAGGMPMMLADDPAPLVVETAQGEQRFRIEIADSERERERGLMFRRSMGDDHGMLFVFPDSRMRAFWMKNTPMALDLLFIGEDGRVRAVMAGEPYSTAEIAPDVAAQFVLELKAGTAQKTGIMIGDRLRHPRIDGVTGTTDR